MQNRTVSVVLVLLLLLLLLFPFLLNQKPGYVVVQLSNHLLSKPHQFSFRKTVFEKGRRIINNFQSLLLSAAAAIFSLLFGIYGSLKLPSIVHIIIIPLCCCSIV
jgi:hypothetical protein